MSDAPESANRFLYTGKAYDAAIDKYHFDRRAYDPQSSRFLQQDTHNFVETQLPANSRPPAPGYGLPEFADPYDEGAIYGKAALYDALNRTRNPLEMLAILNKITRSDHAPGRDSYSLVP